MTSLTSTSTCLQRSEFACSAELEGCYEVQATNLVSLLTDHGYNNMTVCFDLKASNLEERNK
jgi:hypothetical protein